MERTAGLLHNDTPQQKLDKLDALLAQTSASVQDAALIAEMLSLPNDGRYPRSRTDAAAAQAKNVGGAYNANGDAVAAKACADDLRGRALGRPNQLGSVRTDRRPNSDTRGDVASDVPARVRARLGSGRSYVTALIINRLTEHQASAMIDRVVGNKRLPASICHDIMERSDGIPLFVEEITRAVLEAAETERPPERAAAVVPSLRSPRACMPH